MAYLKCLRNVSASSIPDGKTVTPTDDISIWLACGGRSETYTTLSQVLADSTCLNALINDNNAVDYLVRSTTWASDVCGDSGAMSYIGLNNYASNTLLADSTWCNAICNSAYFESVLNVKVPIMTSNNTPSGVCSASSVTSGYDVWKAFDGNNTTFFNEGTPLTVGVNGWIAYTFSQNVTTYKVVINSADITADTSDTWGNFTFLTDNDTIVDSTTETALKANNTWIISGAISGKMQKITFGHNRASRLGINEIQFYGRADI